jgi:hypothetical protein
MNCRVPGCPKLEWMARELCDRHWKMLPEQLQLSIRNALRDWRVAAGNGRKQLRNALDNILYPDALKIIAEREANNQVAAEIATFRTHMASVAGVVAALRTIPVDDLRTQLSTSAESLQRTDAEGYQQQRNKIDMDLEILELLGETRARLGDLIKRWQPVMAPEVSE